MFLDPPESEDCHRRCNNDRCLAYQNDLTTYQTKHVTGCNCEQLSIDTKRLNEIVEDGSLPLLRIQEGHTLDELSLELVCSQPTSRYIALSHVWADGLGNPYKNALPRCQLEFLRRKIKDYYEDADPETFGGILLWCDVLCCPVEPGKAKDMVLKQMKTIYQEATRVLVLDASIRMYDFKTIDPDEACIRIINSGWTRRLWTLQEGALAANNSRLAFLFRDGAINLSYLRAKISPTSKMSICRRGLAENVLYQIISFASVSYEVEGQRHGDLGSVEAGLQHRSVSVPSDEPLLIANLLDLDVASILNGPCPLTNCANVGCDHSRIHRLWLLMPTAFQGIPRTILFRVGPRLSEPGYRWAPSTLLYIEPLNEALQSRVQSKDNDTSAIGATIRPPDSVVYMLPYLFRMLLSTLWKPVADFLSYLGVSVLAVSRASAIVRSLKPTNLVSESVDRGIPTGRGLLVRFTGHSLCMARCPPGIPKNPWNIRQQEDGINFRGVDGEWYMISRRLPAERDSFLSSKPLREIIEEEGGDLWITYVKSAFSNPVLVAQAKGGQQVTNGLLVQLISDEKGIKYVQSKLHINVAVVRTEMRKLFETAYQSAKQISRNLPRIIKATKCDEDKNRINGIHSPPNKLLLERLGQEIQRVATRNASPDVAAATTAFSENGFMLFQSVIAMMLAGEYGCLGARTAESQRWCFD